MAKKIFKYELDTTDYQEVAMPKGSEILCIQTQNGRPYIWAIVDPDAKLTKRSFKIYGTGHSMIESEDLKYIGTYQLKDGLLVFHCFELL